ncbi:hypothetical protein [Francisella marina]|uniref:Uncharacterized protein n=1 Tax=Francisella marina TaxID=2249302 RepID=A0ABX5ZH60_9GAMM|nr:hypothetical protein [Francisella marina]QEO57585.1 hypothetical protein F0R74_06855 [Francisella marina]QEO58300.1 hypothetical protein F0R75_00385 [Francisella marina]
MENLNVLKTTLFNTFLTAKQDIRKCTAMLKKYSSNRNKSDYESIVAYLNSCSSSIKNSDNKQYKVVSSIDRVSERISKMTIRNCDNDEIVKSYLNYLMRLINEIL